MRFSLRQLRRYLSTSLSAQQLIEAITDVGLEVEEVIDLGMISGKVIVGQLTKIEPIEGADKIRMTEVNVGGAAPLRIICGAMNISVGDKVPVAQFGMVFPDGSELKPKKIRGIEGQGMLCSARELGVAEDAEGIWLLPADTPIGDPYDALVTIKITANRPDALSMIGIARDLAARTKGDLRLPDATFPEGSGRADARARVTVEARADCPRYAARVIEGVRVGPSPAWLRHALEAAGKRPINNIVDVTNFVMLETGHPLHAFDLDRITDRHVVVRLAGEGEELETLDGQIAKLAPTDLLIADPKRGIALAGVMGGANSEIGESTTNILLESAYFRPTTIRKTARRLEKNTDASYRFERGMDPQKLSFALQRAAALIAELGGGSLLKGTIDVVADLPPQPRIILRLARVSAMLACEISGREIAEILTALGFVVLRSDPGELLVEVPSHRPDVSIEEDLIEEVARIAGYDRIPEVLPRLSAEAKSPSPVERLVERIRDAFVELGFCEAINFSFVAEGANALFGAADERQVRVRNPLHAEQGVMRRSLIPSLLANLVHNSNHGVTDVRLFEIAHTYEWETDAASAARPPRDLKPVAIETMRACALLSGGGKPNWRESEHDADFFDIKGTAEAIVARLGVSRVAIEPLRDTPWLHPGRAATLLVKGEPVMRFGEVHPAVAKELGLRRRACVLDIALGTALAEAVKQPTYSELPKFPPSPRDLAIVVDKAATAQEIERTIRKAGQPTLASLALFDVYEAAQIGEGKRSLAYSLTFRAADRTLQDNEVAATMDAIAKALRERHGAVVRD